MGVEPKIGVIKHPPNHPFVHRVWNHEINHPFWGLENPLFLVQHPHVDRVPTSVAATEGPFCAVFGVPPHFFRKHPNWDI